MCGIAGIFHCGTMKPVDPARIGAMTDALVHRGPDGAGVWTAPGVGLAANQCGVLLRLSVMDCSDDKTQPKVLINPEILSTDERQEMEEGCLSVPQIFDKVERHRTVTVRALDRDGQSFDLQAEGLASVCVQHEMDHLLGKVFVEYLSPLKRDRIKTKLVKKAREDEAEARRRPSRI